MAGDDELRMRTRFTQAIAQHAGGGWVQRALWLLDPDEWNGRRLEDGRQNSEGA
jgi:hypothetical protein